MKQGTRILFQGRPGEVLSCDILTDFVTIELYGPEPFHDRRKVVPASEVETVDEQTQGAGGSADAAHGDTAVAAPSGSAHAISAQPPAPSDIREVATKVSRSEARWLAMVRVAGIDLRREVRKVT